MKNYLFLVLAIVLFTGVNGYSQDNPGGVTEGVPDHAEVTTTSSTEYTPITPYREKREPVNEEETVNTVPSNTDTESYKSDVKQENGVTDGLRND